MTRANSYLLLLSPLVLIVFPNQVIGLSIDTKLDLPNPSSSLTNNGELLFPMDSSLSPKIIKAFYEINFVQIAKPDPHKSHITLTDPKGCPYSKELCKYYFAPSKVTVVQKVEDLIQESKKNPSLTSEVPVIQGITVTDEEKLLKELSPKIATHLRKSKGIPRNQKDTDEVPVYRGTVNVDRVMKSPEVSTMPDYRPHYPEVNRQCFQGSCWRTYHN